MPKKKKKRSLYKAEKKLTHYLAAHPAVLIAAFALAFIITSLVILSTNPNQLMKQTKSYIHTSPGPSY